MRTTRTDEPASDAVKRLTRYSQSALATARECMDAHERTKWLRIAQRYADEALEINEAMKPGFDTEEIAA